MGIEINFTAKVKSYNDFLTSIKNMKSKFEFDYHEDDNVIKLHFCYFDDIAFVFAKNKVTLDCQTNHIGAGFHAYVIDFLVALTEKNKFIKKAKILDETNYYQLRNFEQLQCEFRYWIVSMFRGLVEEKNDIEQLYVCWSTDQYKPKVFGNFITPMGYHNKVDIIAKGEAAFVDYFEKEFYIWNCKQRDARFYRNYAMAMMWNDCRFKSISRTEQDKLTNLQIISFLEKSIAMDRLLPFPIKEYKEICQLSDRIPIKTDDLVEYTIYQDIGYRKHVITYTLGEFEFNLPGYYLLDEVDGGVVIFDEEPDWHTIHISVYKSEKLKFFLDEPNTETFHVPEAKCQLVYKGKLNEGGYYAMAEILSENQHCIMTICYSNENDKGYVEEFLKDIVIRKR